MEEENSLESQLIKYFRIIAEGERRLDISRQVLYETKGFEPNICFDLLDVDHKGYISGTDIYNFLFKYDNYLL